MKINNYKIGSDIEVFIQNERGKFVSAAGDKFSNYAPIVPGSKHSPYYLDDNKDFAIETDNVSIEFLIPPTTVEDDFVHSINFMINYIKGSLPAGLSPIAIASAEFDEDQLETEQARMFGCDRDLNAWSGRFNKRPSTDTRRRSNGFHIHLGYDDPSFQTSIAFVKAMDYFIGLDSVTIDPDTERRTLYGKAGSFRIKPYGVEYRTLSSYLISKDDYIRTVFQATKNAVDFVNSGKKISLSLGRQIEKAINTNNVEIVNKIRNKDLIAI